MNPEEGLRKTFQIATVISAAICSSMVIYAVVVEIIVAQSILFKGVAHTSNIASIRYLLYALALLLVFFINALRKSLLRKIKSDKLGVVRSRLLKTSIVTSALCEVPAIFGLVLFFIGGLRRDFYILLVFSFALLYLYFPRYKAWEEWNRNIHK
jgi:hypothetical protein